MPHKKRKVRKKRGSRTHGYGRVGQHRGGGQRGGHGKAGLHKHKWTHIIKYAPNYFSKHGFKSFRKPKIDTINISELDEQIDKLLNNKQATKTKEGIIINLRQLGYDKLLGGGHITHSFIIKVDSCSKSVVKKIELSGGKIIKTNARVQRNDKNM